MTLTTTHLYYLVGAILALTSLMTLADRHIPGAIRAHSSGAFTRWCSSAVTSFPPRGSALA